MAFHQITLSQLVQGRIMQNVICVQDPSDAMTQQNIAGRIITDWIPVIKVVQWNQTTWNDITIKQMFVGPTPPTFKQSINIVGTGGTSKSIGWQAW